MMTKFKLEELHQIAKERFKHFLEINNNRKTPERFAILKEIYLHQKHFDADMLYNKMKQNSYRVSRATIYNTLDIMMRCKLIKRHQMGDMKAIYEKSFGFEDHNHIICEKCGQIMEFQNEELLHMLRQEAANVGFTPSEFTVNIYGECTKCKK